ncbi:hypothetical protein RMSM_07530 [Rhodopirellula maiorica SM1]|uniref:Uncharacterized protein n=1 Tax=Rhodopirellula maiorica SM1 TaxID=1265738 RepID=M5R920_9BACT|nr:hypothetical protein RMSM_07530 [Rhodopirellula maiorica SM1]
MLYRDDKVNAEHASEGKQQQANDTVRQRGRGLESCVQAFRSRRRGVGISHKNLLPENTTPENG